MRIAAIVGPACFLWGAAGVHIHDMITTRNFAPGNAGIIFYSDILVPILGIPISVAAASFSKENAALSVASQALWC